MLPQVRRMGLGGLKVRSRQKPLLRLWKKMAGAPYPSRLSSETIAETTCQPEHWLLEVSERGATVATPRPLHAQRQLATELMRGCYESLHCTFRALGGLWETGIKAKSCA
jgi:hypothetical protein